MKDVWEKIDESTTRMRVPGGWIVRTVFWRDAGVAVHQILVKDVGHAWDPKDPSTCKTNE